MSQEVISQEIVDTPPVSEPASVSMPAPVAAVVPVAPAAPVVSTGLSEVFDIRDKDGNIAGHYQWATYKDGKRDSLVVVKVVKDHEGNPQVLYKTYAESAKAKQAFEEASGTVEVKEKLATVKLGEQYKAKDGTVSTYGIGNLLEFQGFGFVLVLFVLVTMWFLLVVVSKALNAMGLTKEAPKSGASQQPATIHPGMKDETFAALVGAVAAKTTIHPGMSDEQFLAIITAVAAQFLGKNVSVVKFKPLNTMDWTWAIQGRVALHTNKV
ncbi:MAG: hypothetical protein LBU89_03880 [Fibromonadaceae bacterium]|jgi:hypothetical protein|nr:hypothetical protein [Fibromonadaceae bacterium]